MEGRAALWTLVGIFVVFKIATTVMIILAAPEAAAAIVGFFIAFHWPFILGGIIFGLAPAMFWIRLVRVRAKRARLQAAEWRVDPAAPTWVVQRFD
ncbi:MAG TPA: hypothetical protein VFC51_07190 [Chloroflexota bacterium]|nr:hypothetical protein [Chloroflexota bacterium]